MAVEFALLARPRCDRCKCVAGHVVLVKDCRSLADLVAHFAAAVEAVDRTTEAKARQTLCSKCMSHHFHAKSAGNLVDAQRAIEDMSSEQCFTLAVDSELQEALHKQRM